MMKKVEAILLLLLLLPLLGDVRYRTRMSNTTRCNSNLSVQGGGRERERERKLDEQMMTME